jgi:hypothetical protein
MVLPDPLAFGRGDPMADNITAPATGAVLATDEIGNTHYPRSKVGFGADGVYNDVSADAPLPVAIVAGGSSGDATAALQTAGNDLLASILAATDTLETLIGQVNATLADAEYYPPTQPVSAAALPLPAGAATSAKQDNVIAAIATIGTRAYGAGIARVAIGASDNPTSGLAATEVMLHASARCFVRVGAAATINDIPLEAGEKFTLRLNSGQQIHVIGDTDSTGFLNVVPVA